MTLKLYPLCVKFGKCKGNSLLSVFGNIATSRGFHSLTLDMPVLVSEPLRPL